MIFERLIPAPDFAGAHKRYRVWLAAARTHLIHTFCTVRLWYSKIHFRYSYLYDLTIEKEK